MTSPETRSDLKAGGSRLVVGVDDSPGARAALSWAIGEAALRQAPLEVVHAWALPLAEGWNSEWPVDEAWFRERAREFLVKIISEVATPQSAAVEVVPVPLETEVPALGLVEWSEGAHLLVVGSRGRGGFKGLLLGSVSAQCVHYATCPVVVIKVPAT